MTNQKKTIVVTGGGTGGHIFPALAIAKELQRRGFTLIYVGGAQGMEARLVPPTGIPFFSVRSGAVKNQSFLKILKTLGHLLSGVLASFRLLRKEKPVCVIGVGGYISVPVVFAAFLCRIPIYLQEQNASVGIANRFLGKIARRVFLGFEEAASAFPHGVTVFTGNPLREPFYTTTFPPHDSSAARLLIIGGSQGARVINRAVVDSLERMQREFPNIQILHQTGESDLAQVRAAYAAGFKGQYDVVSFIPDMVEAYGKASLVIARSGALTCSELIQVQRPALLVPFPRRGQNDQTANAAWLQAKGCARVVEQGEGFTERFWCVFSEVFQPTNLGLMASGYRGLRTENGLVTIGDQIQQELC